MIDGDAFYNGYLECALWSSEPDGEDPPWDVDRLAPATVDRLRADADAFATAHADTLALVWDADGLSDSRLGHDFWLTRNGHGAGFWDGDVSEPYATQLTDASRAAGECDLYTGDDGRIYAA